MTDHVDVLALVRGELSNESAATASSHLRTCERCAGDLVDAVLGHAVLTAATRTLGRPEATTLSAPRSPAPRARPRGARLAPVWAAVVVALVGVGLSLWWWSDESPEPAVPEAATARASLEPVTADGAGSGEVEMTQEEPAVARMTIRTHGLPATSEDDFYYAWLLDPATQKMLPLGQVGPAGAASFTLPPSLLDHYSVVDISLEADDGDPAHSVTSVLRAPYDPGALGGG